MEKLVINQKCLQADVRTCNFKNQRWFCLSDICKCIGVKKEAASNYAKRTEDSEKTKIKRYIFISPKATQNFILNCKTEQGKEIKEYLLDYIKNNSESTIEIDEENNTEVEMENDPEIDAVVARQTRPSSPIRFPTLNKHEESSELIPTSKNCLMTNPEVAKFYIEKEAEIQRLKIEMEYKLKMEHLQVEREKAKSREDEKAYEWWLYMCKEKEKRKLIDSEHQAWMDEQEKWMSQRRSGQNNQRPAERERCFPVVSNDV